MTRFQPPHHYPAARVSGIFTAFGGIIGGVIYALVNWSAGGAPLSLSLITGNTMPSIILGLPPAITMALLAVAFQVHRTFWQITALSAAGAAISLLYMVLLVLNNDLIYRSNAWEQISIVAIVGGLTTAVISLLSLPEKT